MRVVIAGGGTGGHLFPGLALAEELRRRGDHEVLFVGTARGIEARVVPGHGFRLELIDVVGLKGRRLGALLGGLWRLPRALVQSLAILRRFRPAVVVGVGGYASGPLVLAAVLGGRPTAILEQNSIPGVTNRILGHLVGAVFATFEESRRFFPAKKFRLAGNPIRAVLRAAPPPSEASGRTVLISGGSQGAHALNERAVAAVHVLAERGPLPTVIHQTGSADRESVSSQYRAAGLPAEVHAFIDDMAGAYQRADLVVCRAGATTLAELTALGRAAILVPFPHAADDHQTRNARALEAIGGAVVIAEKDLVPARLAEAMGRLLADDDARLAMAERARSLGRPQAACEIVEALVGMGEKP